MRINPLSHSRGFSLPELLLISKNVTVSGAGADGVTCRHRSGALLVILCGLFLSLPAPAGVADFEAVFEAEVTVGLRGNNYGYGREQFGDLNVTRADTTLGALKARRRQDSTVRFYMPAGTADADSVFDRMRISAGGSERTFRRARAGGDIQDADGQYWLWYGGADIIPRAVGETYTLAFSRPPADCNAVYTAEVTTGNRRGYERHGYGSLSVSDPDPDSGAADASEHVGEVMLIARSAGSVSLMLPQGTNHDDVFRVMRLSRDGRFWDF